MVDAHDLELLREALFLSGLSDSAFQEFAAETPVVTLAAGQVVFHQGDPATAFYFVLDGWIAVFRERADGERTAIHLVGPGDSFAEAILAHEAEYPATAEAATAVRLARIDTARFRHLIADSPELALSIISTAFAKLKRLVARIEQDQGWPPSRRVAAFLYKICPDKDGFARFELPVEQRYIAARLSMTPATLSRALGELASIGVDAKRRKIIVSDVRRLERFANAGDA
jgi:CRP-like cAMP-binding protein